METPRRQLAFQVVWTIALVASTAAVVVLNRTTARDARTGDRADQAAAARYGFTLVEAARELGVEFVHQGPTFDARLEHIMPQVTSMGAAVAVGDFDRDGWQDFYITNSGEATLNRLYRNDGDGTFTDVASEMGVADLNRVGTGVSMGAVWGDYDNDGYEDLFVYKWGRPELFHNEQGRGFTAVTGNAGLPAWINANAAVWLDYDRDGRLDLFIGCFYPEDVDLWNLSGTRILPESFEYAQNGGRNYLFRNLGDGRFEDVAPAAGLPGRR